MHTGVWTSPFYSFTPLALLGGQYCNKCKDITLSLSSKSLGLISLSNSGLFVMILSYILSNSSFSFKV